MIISSERFQAILQENNIPKNQQVQPLVYRYGGRWACSELIEDLTVKEHSYSPVYSFRLSLSADKTIAVKRMVNYSFFIPKTPGQLSIDPRPGHIYNNHPGEAILEENELHNMYLIFRCLSSEKKGSYDWLVYYNFTLVHTFQNVDQLHYDSYNFSLDFLFASREVEPSKKQIWQYTNGREIPVNINELSFGDWCFFFGKSSLRREYSKKNPLSVYHPDTHINSSDMVLWECRFGHIWEDSIQNRIQKSSQHINDGCPQCLSIQQQFKQKTEDEQRQLVVEYKAQLDMCCEFILKGIYWKNDIVFPDQVDYYFYYPSGKNGDVTYYLAQKYANVEKIDNLLHKASFFTENYEWFDCLRLGAGRQITPDIKHELNEKNHSFNTFMRENYYPYRMTAIREECLLKNINIPMYFLMQCDAVLREWRTSLRKKWNCVYAQLLTEGVSSSRWTSEQQMFSVIKSLFDDAIYQYKVSWLGFQSLDVFIPSINVGVEYQGLQHYQPVDFFGGQRAFEERVRLDQNKKNLCRANNVTLIEWRYDELISKEVALLKLSNWIKQSNSSD